MPCCTRSHTAAFQCYCVCVFMCGSVLWLGALWKAGGDPSPRPFAATLRRAPSPRTFATNRLHEPSPPSVAAKFHRKPSPPMCAPRGSGKRPDVSPRRGRKHPAKGRNEGDRRQRKKRLAANALFRKNWPIGRVNRQLLRPELPAIHGGDTSVGNVCRQRSRPGESFFPVGNHSRQRTGQGGAPAGNRRCATQPAPCRRVGSGIVWLRLEGRPPELASRVLGSRAWCQEAL